MRKEDGPAYVPSKGWAEMIRKVYEVDPLLCPSCGSRMSVVSFIEELKIIVRIIGHLELTFEAERPPPPHQVSKNSLWQPRRAGNISEGLCGCFLSIRGRNLAKIWQFGDFGELVSLDEPLTWPFWM